jgi:hypothetical protein
VKGPRSCSGRRTSASDELCRPVLSHICTRLVRTEEIRCKQRYPHRVSRRIIAHLPSSTLHRASASRRNESHGIIKLQSGRSSELRFCAKVRRGPKFSIHFIPGSRRGIQSTRLRLLSPKYLRPYVRDDILTAEVRRRRNKERARDEETRIEQTEKRTQHS